MIKYFKIIFSTLGAALGLGIAVYLNQLNILGIKTLTLKVFSYILIMLVFFAVFFLISGFVFRIIMNVVKTIEDRLEKLELSDLLISIAGFVIGLLLAGLISTPLSLLKSSYITGVVFVIISIFINIIFGLLGIRIALSKKNYIKNNLFFFNKNKSVDDATTTISLPDKKNSNIESNTIKFIKKYSKKACIPKILDTSVLIDGRIECIIDKGFLEGPFVISMHVLQELQFLSDSSVDLNRTKGRNGLDLIVRLRNNHSGDIVIDESEYGNITEVDLKLATLSKDLNGVLVTNDFNLNKVATINDIKVININELSLSIMLPVTPGDKFNVSIMKHGKTQGQGIGYLQDGTMIVVEDGEKFIGNEKLVEVTSAIQTSAGRMIFAKVIN